MASGSAQETKGRVRRDRVHIQLDVETGKAYPMRELPFVVGVMGDFSGDPTAKLKPFKQRDFVNLTKDNFDEVMKGMKVGLNIRVKNTLEPAEEGKESELGVNLKFESMEDFSPVGVAKQVPALQKLLELREQLKTLKAKAGGSDELESILESTAKKIAEAKKEAAKDQGGK